MLVYILMFFLLLCISSFFENHILILGRKNFDKEKCYLVFTGIVLSIISGFRAFSIGTDTHDYANSFATLDFKYEAYETLSKLFVDVVRLFTHNPTIYLTICALFINGLILVAVYRMSENIRYSVFIYVALLFYFTSFNAIRQAMAYVMILNSLYYIREKKWMKYTILLIAATLFHKSAIIGILYVLIPFINSRGEKKADKDLVQRYSILHSVIIILLTSVFALIAYKYFDRLLEYGAQFFPDYQVYLVNEYRSITGGIQQAVVYSTIFICFTVLVPSNAKEKTTYIVPLVAAVVLAFASMKMAYIARFMYYFDISTILSIPYMINHNVFTQKSNRIFKSVITAVCVAFLIYGLLNNYMRVTNYLFFWQM